MSARFDSWDGMTDSARDVLRAVLTAIAGEYVTDARWQAHLVSQAENQVTRRTEDRDKANPPLTCSSVSTADALC